MDNRPNLNHHLSLTQLQIEVVLIKQAMLIHILSGEDTVSLNNRINQIVEEHTHPQWRTFNYIKLNSTNQDTIADAITEIRTIPFGEGAKVVHINQASIFNNCADEIIQFLEENLKAISTTNGNVLLVTSTKIDCRGKAIKLLSKYGTIEEFPLIPSWNKKEIRNLINHSVSKYKLSLTEDAIDYLVDAIVNNTTRLDRELKKLSIYAAGEILNKETIIPLVNNSTSKCIELAHACLTGKVKVALELLNNSMLSNEHPLIIAATLYSCFRTWLIVKAGMIEKLKDEEIVRLANLKNPKRLYFLKAEIQFASVEKLKQSLEFICSLEHELKQGINNLEAQIIKLCSI